MSDAKQITIEGYTADELLSLPEEQIDTFVLSLTPVVFKIGSAEILGQFRIHLDSLVVELAHIDGGGEGVLTTLWSVTEKCAAKKRLRKVEWVVHAVHCAKPNLKLRRVLELKGFQIEDVEGMGEAYRYIHDVPEQAV